MRRRAILHAATALAAGPLVPRFARAHQAELEPYRRDPPLSHARLRRVDPRDECVDGRQAGEATPFGPGSFEMALLAAGGAITAPDAVLDGRVRNAYALVRPPGHHAEADRGRGFCIFGNVVLEDTSGARRHPRGSRDPAATLAGLAGAGDEVPAEVVDFKTIRRGSSVAEQLIRNQ